MWKFLREFAVSRDCAVQVPYFTSCPVSPQPPLQLGDSVETLSNRVFAPTAPTGAAKLRPMRRRPLGNSGLEVSEIGFGSWAIGGNMWGPQDEGSARAALVRALEIGADFFDTAAVYGEGRSEELIGDVLREVGRGPTAVVATKIPPKNFRWPAAPGIPLSEAFPKEWIVRQTEASLRRLRVDRIDLQQLHVWTDSWTDESEWWEALESLRSAGKIRAFGISINSFEPESALRIVLSGRIASVQVVHNVFEQAPEDRLFPAAQAAGVGIVARVPFDESSLTGKLRPDSHWPESDFRSRYFAGNKLRDTLERVDRLRPLVPRAASSLPRLALRYCLSHPAVSSVIPGIRSVAQAEENAAASSDGPLSAETLAELRSHRWDRRP